MVDIIGITDAILQVHIVIDRSKNIVFRDMLGNQIVYVFADRFFDLFQFAVFFQNLCENRIVHQFRNPYFFWFHVHIILQIYHHIGKNLDISGLSLDPHIRYCRILNTLCKVTVYFRSFFCKNLSGRHIHNVFGERMPVDAVFQRQFFVEFISSYFCKVISSRVKKHCRNKAFRTFYRKRFARADLLI